MASPTVNKGYEYAVHGGSVGSWDTQLNKNIECQDLNLGGYYQITASSTTSSVTFNSSYATIPSTATSITFSASLAQNMFYDLLGTRSQNLSINMPAVGSIYCFANNSSGATTTTVLPAAGSGVTLPLGLQVIVVTNSTGANYANNPNTFDSISVSSGVTAQLVTASSAVSAQSVTASSAISGQSVTASSAVSGAIVTGAMIASSATQVTGTSTTSIVAPAYQLYHESACKAWANFSGAAGTIVDSYRVSGVSRTAAGQYTVTLSGAFTNNDYAIQATAQDTGGSAFAQVTAAATNTFGLRVRDATGASIDPTAVSFSCFGTLA